MAEANVPDAEVVDAPPDAPIENYSTVDDWATTYPEYHLATFHWRIKNFLLAIKNRCSIYSPKFEDRSHYESIPGERTWQLRLIPDSFVKTEQSKNTIAIDLSLLKNTVEGRAFKKVRGKFRAVPVTRNVNSCRASMRLYIVNGKGDVVKEAGGEAVFTFTLSEWGIEYFLKMDEILLNKEEWLQEGDLVLKCEIRIPSNDDRHRFKQGYGGAWRRRLPEKNKKQLARDSGNLYRKTTLSDVVIHAESSNTDYPAHKAILAKSSLVFRCMFNPDYQTQELQQSVVKIPVFDGPVVNAMLEYIYTHEVPTKFLQTRCAELFQIAEMFGLEDLSIICQEAIAVNMNEKNCLQILAIADMHGGATLLKEECLQFIKNNEKVLKKDRSFKKALKSHPEIVTLLL